MNFNPQSIYTPKPLSIGISNAPLYESIRTTPTTEFSIIKVLEGLRELRCLLRPLEDSEKQEGLEDLTNLKSAFEMQGESSPVKDFEVETFENNEIGATYKLGNNFGISIKFAGIQHSLKSLTSRQFFHAKQLSDNLYGVNGFTVVNLATGEAHDLLAPPFISEDIFLVALQIQKPLEDGIGVATEQDIQEYNERGIRFTHSEDIRHNVGTLQSYSYSTELQSIKKCLPLCIEDLMAYLHEAGHSKSQKLKQNPFIKSIHNTTDLTEILAIIEEEDFANRASLEAFAGLIKDDPHSTELMKRAARSAAQRMTSYYLTAMMQNPKVVAHFSESMKEIYGVSYEHAVLNHISFQGTMMRALCPQEPVQSDNVYTFQRSVTPPILQPDDTNKLVESKVSSAFPREDYLLKGIGNSQQQPTPTYYSIISSLITKYVMNNAR